MEEKESKPEGKEAKKLNLKVKLNFKYNRIKVVYATDEPTHFQVKPTTKFKKIFKAFFKSKSIQEGSCHFLIDGKRIDAEETPEDYDMQDGDQIDALGTQVGG